LPLPPPPARLVEPMGRPPAPVPRRHPSRHPARSANVCVVTYVATTDGPTGLAAPAYQARAPGCASSCASLRPPGSRRRCCWPRPRPWPGCTWPVHAALAGQARALGRTFGSLRRFGQPSALLLTASGPLAGPAAPADRARAHGWTCMSLRPTGRPSSLLTARAPAPLFSSPTSRRPT